MNRKSRKGWLASLLTILVALVLGGFTATSASASAPSVAFAAADTTTPPPMAGDKISVSAANGTLVTYTLGGKAAQYDFTSAQDAGLTLNVLFWHLPRDEQGNIIGTCADNQYLAGTGGSVDVNEFNGYILMYPDNDSTYCWAAVVIGGGEWARGQHPDPDYFEVAAPQAPSFDDATLTVTIPADPYSQYEVSINGSPAVRTASGLLAVTAGSNVVVTARPKDAMAYYPTATTWSWEHTFPAPPAAATLKVAAVAGRPCVIKATFSGGGGVPSLQAKPRWAKVKVLRDDWYTRSVWAMGYVKFFSPNRSQNHFNVTVTAMFPNGSVKRAAVNNFYCTRR